MIKLQLHYITPTLLFVCLLFTTSQTLAEMQPLHETKSVAEWQKEVASPDEDKKILAIQCLGFYGKEAEPAIPVLRACLTFPNPKVKGVSLDALVRIYKYKFEYGSDNRGEDELLKALKANIDSITVLLVMESVATDRSLVLLTSTLQHEAPVVQYFALQRIERLIRNSTGGLWTAEQEYRRKVHARWKEQARVCLSPLINLLGSDNPTLAAAAAQTIAAFGYYDSDVAKPAVAPLIELLKKGDYRLKHAVIGTLCAIGRHANDAVPALMEVASQEESRMLSGQKLDPSWGLSDWAIRSSCLAALGDMRHNAKPALPLILKAMVAEDEQIRSVAASSLEQIGVIAEAIPILVKNLRDPHPKVRLSSALALRKSGENGADAIPALAQALSDEDKEVRFGAAEALRDLAPYASASLPALRARRDDEDRFVRTIVQEAIVAIEKVNGKNGANKELKATGEPAP